MSYTHITIKSSTRALLDDVEKRLLRMKPELENLHISKDKLIFEMAKCYLRNNI